MNTSDLTKLVGGNRLRIMGWLSSLGFIMLIVSIFSWMWIDWYWQWRLMLSGLLLFVIFQKLHDFTESLISKVVDQEVAKVKKQGKPLSKFQQRLEDMKLQKESIKN